MEGRLNMKSKFKPKMIDRIANAWYNGYSEGAVAGKYHYKIAYNHEKHCWGIWKCHNDLLDKKTMWEWVEELPEERFRALTDKEILIL